MWKSKKKDVQIFTRQKRLMGPSDKRHSRQEQGQEGSRAELKNFQGRVVRGLELKPCKSLLCMPKVKLQG